MLSYLGKRGLSTQLRFALQRTKNVPTCMYSHRQLLRYHSRDASGKHLKGARPLRQAFQFLFFYHLNAIFVGLRHLLRQML